MFGRNKRPDRIEIKNEINIANGVREVYCVTDSEESAVKIAEAYSIILDNYSEGVAVFTIPEGRNPEEVIEYGEINNLPMLVPNTTQSIK